MVLQADCSQNFFLVTELKPFGLVPKNLEHMKLTPYALRELVKGIYVEAPDKSSGKRKQKAHIEYDLVGFIPVDELMKAEKV